MRTPDDDRQHARKEAGDVMIFGITLPNYSTFGNRTAMVAIGREADQLGFQSLWVTDHVLMPRESPVDYARAYEHLLEVVTTLSYLAGLTSRARLATSVLVLPQRDPRLLAKQIATLHHLSEGRVIFGVGLGWIEQEFTLLGADFAARGRIADEYIQVLRELWAADPVASFHGKYIEFDDAIFSPRPETPIPIVIGGTSNAAIRRAATLGDGWHSINLSPQEVADGMRILTEHAISADYDISLRITTALGQIERPYPVIQGSGDQILDAVERYRQAGVTHLVLEPAAETTDDFVAQIRALAKVLALS
jgi:probable F420-dependent oxidoreductase